MGWGKDTWDSWGCGERTSLRAEGGQPAGASKQFSSYFKPRHLGGDWATTELSPQPPVHTDTQRPKSGRFTGTGTLALLGEHSVKMPSKLFLLARNK